MLIEVYYKQVRDLIESYEIVEFFSLDCEQRGLYEGFIRGKIDFKDRSVLHLREFVDVEVVADRKMYSYQYMDRDNTLIFRYDNTEHHQKLNLSSFPHHKHEESEENVIRSNAPFLADVLHEISLLHPPQI